MPLPFEKDYLSLAVNDSQWENDHGIALIRHEIGQIKITSGQLVACDPTWDDWGDEKAFTQTVPIGEYPVRMTIAHFQEENAKVVNFVAIRFDADSQPVRWQMMLTEGQDVSTLGDKNFFGYGVDGGTGCFLDYEITQLLSANESSDELLDDMLDEVLDKWWSFADVGKGNIVVFHTGWGDGAYPVFAGYDADENLVAVVTDFMCFYEEYHGPVEDDE